MKTQPNPLRAAALALAYAIATAVLGGFAPPQANAQVSLQGVYPRSANANVFEQATEDLPAVIILRNDGPEDVSVEGYSLSDDPTDVTKWVIPAGWTIPRNGGTLNIFADEKDERPGPGQGELHTNFLYDCRVPRLIVANPNKQVVINYSDGTLKDCPPCEGNIVLGKRYDARVWVPRPGAGLPKDWEFPGFSDADWQVGSLGVGYDRGAEDPICDGLILYHTNDDVDLISGPAFPLIKDISGGGAQHDGELRNGVNDGAGGQVDQSFFFIDGAHIRVPHHDELEPGAGSFAAATWVYIDDPGDEYAVMCKRDSSGAGWDISLAGDRAIFRIVTTGGKTFADASPQGSIRGQEWVHLALVVDRVNRELRGYVDGTKVVSVPIDSDDVKADADLNFARHPVANQANPLRGGMDEVAIWNRSLTDVEADTIYQRGRDKKRLKDTAGGTGGPGGSGLYDPLINFDVESLMYGQNSTILIRCPFDLQGVDPSLITRMTIKMHYDDGFIMYLNGNEIARENAPTAPPGPFSASLGPRPDGQALAASVYEITDPAVFASLTTAFNSNVLAVHGLNENPNADRFVILPEICIEFRDPPGECIKDTLGTEFWLAFPENYPDRSGNPLQLKLCITGPPQTSGEVRFPGFSCLGTKTWTITENGGNCVVDVDVPASLELSGDEAIEDKAVQVVSFGAEVAVCHHAYQLQHRHVSRLAAGLPRAEVFHPRLQECELRASGDRRIAARPSRLMMGPSADHAVGGCGKTMPDRSSTRRASSTTST
ncbi:MAG: LamG domain-containing protein [Verrucomicrobiales bacterium]